MFFKLYLIVRDSKYLTVTQLKYLAASKLETITGYKKID